MLTMDDLRRRRCLIIQADDLAMSHSINQASFNALETGAITSASVMSPCASLSEVAEFSARHPTADFGLHLTLTSECPNSKWGPLSQHADREGLVDHAGYFPSEVDALRLTVGSIVDEGMSQFRAIEKAGINPTHIDCHMMAAFSTPNLLRSYLELVAKMNRLA